MVDEDGGLDFRHVFRLGRGAVERRSRRQIRSQQIRQVVGHAAAEAKAGRGDLSAAVRTRLQPPSRSDEILGPLGGIDLAEQLAALEVVARIAAHRRQRIRREGHEILQGKASRHVLGVRIEPAILVDDDDAGQLRRHRVA